MSEYMWFGIKESETLPYGKKNVIAAANFKQENTTITAECRLGYKQSQLDKKTIKYLSIALDKSSSIISQFCTENAKSIPPVIYVQYLCCSDILTDTKDSLVCLGIDPSKDVRMYIDPIVRNPYTACGLVRGLYALSQVLDGEHHGETISGKKFDND